MTDTERAELVEDFVHIRRDTGLLRRWSQGRIEGAPMELYDPLLMSGCPRD